MTSVSNILKKVKSATGSNNKKSILETNQENVILKRALKSALDPFIPYNVVKVPKVKSRLEFPLDEKSSWEEFFNVLDDCASRKVTGNAAIDRVYTCFSSVTIENEYWMRKVLKKHLAIGVSTKSINKVFPGLVPTFDVSLAQKFDEKRAVGKNICVEPKLDGIRCLAIVRNGKSMLFARSGKQIHNFDNSIGKELEMLPDGVYDGEIMGEDFISLMRQAYRKEEVDVTGTYFAIFDKLTLQEWDQKVGTETCEERYVDLMHTVFVDKTFNHLQVVNRIYCKLSEIENHHKDFVSQGYEGAMVKDLNAPYKFGRGYEVMKLKSFHDVDLKIERLLEGTGKHSGKLGSVVVNYQGVDVQVGSGLTDDLRDAIWEDPNNFLGRTIEVRYQEVTPDGSLRFPTFVCFRNDRD